MSEKEIRSLLRKICDGLDEQARRVTRKVVIPSVLGAGLALSGCGDGRPVGVDGSVATEAALPDQASPDAGVVPPYMGPDVGPPPDYLAPDVGPVPLYLGTPPPDKP